MILRTLFFVGLLTIAAKGFAQAPMGTSVKKFSIGFVAGPSSSTVFGSELENDLEPYYASYPTDPVPLLRDQKGIAFLAFCKFQFHKLFYAKSGFGFLRKGGKVENQYYYIYPVDVRNDYLTVPIIVGFDPLKSIYRLQGISLAIEGGITPNFSLYTKHYNPGGLGPSRSIKTKDLVLMTQCGLSLDIAVVERLIFDVDFTFYKDLHPYYGRRDGPSRDDILELSFKGYSIMCGIVYEFQ